MRQGREERKGSEWMKGINSRSSLRRVEGHGAVLTIWSEAIRE